MSIKIVKALKMKVFLCVVALCAVAVTGAVAQERTAGGSLQTEASWTALQSMIGKTNGDVSIIKTDLNAMKACAADRKIWDPARGCVNIDTTLYDNVVTCGDSGRVYDRSAGGCVPAVAVAPTCRLSSVAKSSSNRGSNDETSCPAGAYVDIKSSSTSDCHGSSYQCTRTQYNCVTVVCN